MDQCRIEKWVEPAHTRSILLRRKGPLLTTILTPDAHFALSESVFVRRLAFPDAHFALRLFGRDGCVTRRLYVGFSVEGRLHPLSVGNHVNPEGGRVCLGDAHPSSPDREGYSDVFWNSVFHVFDEQRARLDLWHETGDPALAVVRPPIKDFADENGLVSRRDEAEFARVVTMIRERFMERESERRSREFARRREMQRVSTRPDYDETWRVDWRRGRVR